jgi:hypothetical protein
MAAPIGEIMSASSAAILLTSASTDSMASGKISSLTDRMVSSDNDMAKLAAIFANLEILGGSDFNELIDEDGDPLPLTKFLLELNNVTGDDEDLVEWYRDDPDMARDMIGPADNYMRRLNIYLGDVSSKDQHEFASGYSADLASSVADKSIGQAFMIVARSAFRGRQLNNLQADVLDTVEFAWG